MHLQDSIDLSDPEMSFKVLTLALYKTYFCHSNSPFTMFTLFALNWMFIESTEVSELYLMQDENI